MRRTRPSALECLEQSQGRFGIDPFPLNPHQAHLLKLQGGMDIQPLPTGGGQHRRMLVLAEPAMGRP